MAVEMSVGLRLLEAHLGRFNEGVRTGDFDPMVEALDPDARLELVGVPAGPFDGREAIRTAYREMPPDDQIDLLGADEPDPGTIIGRWRWHSTGATGRMRLDHAAGVITAVTVSFDPIATQAAAAPAAAGLPAPSATSAPASPPAPTAAASPGAGGAPSAAAAPITADARGPLDAEALRADFPILAERPHGKPLVYLDSAATSQKPLAVIEALDTYYREYNANVHRGIYSIGERATRAYEAARAAVATFINAPDPHEIVFARNATEAINLVAYSWGRRTIGRGDAIVLTEMEHHANLVPWQILAQEVDGDLEFIPITDEGILRLDVFEVLLRLRPKSDRVEPVAGVLRVVVVVTVPSSRSSFHRCSGTARAGVITRRAALDRPDLDDAPPGRVAPSPAPVDPGTRTGRQRRPHGVHRTVPAFVDVDRSTPWAACDSAHASAG